MLGSVVGLSTTEEVWNDFYEGQKYKTEKSKEMLDCYYEGM